MDLKELNLKRDELARKCCETWPHEVYGSKDLEFFHINGFNACADILLPEIDNYSKCHGENVDRILSDSFKITQLEKENAELREVLSLKNEAVKMFKEAFDDIKSEKETITRKLAIATEALEKSKLTVVHDQCDGCGLPSTIVDDNEVAIKALASINEVK